MRVKASTCREQEARQLDLAANDPLERSLLPPQRRGVLKRSRLKNAKPATSVRATSSTRKSRWNFPTKTKPRRYRAGIDTPLSLMIAYALIAALVGALGAVVTHGTTQANWLSPGLPFG